jgi:serine/threonine protein kinase
MSVLGKGSFGKVILVRKRDTGQLYAMKVLKKSYVVKKRQVEHTKTERSVLGSVQHPFIVKLHFAFQTGDKLHLVLDYCSGGELFFHLQNKGRFSQDLALFYTAELALALGALHTSGVVFRDLKPENILLDDVGHIKLADFGLSKEGILDQAHGTRSFCGTPEYLAPEILLRQGHGKAVDWWSLGALLYEMLTGLPPWYSRDRNKMFQSIRSAPLQFPSLVSAEARSLIGGLLTRDPRQRLGGSEDVEEIKNHPIFKEFDFEVRV